MRTSQLDLWNPPPGSEPGPWPFESERPRIRLVKAFPNPFAGVISTAKTCYSSRGIIEDPDSLDDRATELAQDLYHAGHHTTFQHAHFQFSMENVSRQFIWSFLHSHPFYNSEQVSQRYVAVKPGNYAIPVLSPQCREIYVATAEYQTRVYQLLSEKLQPIVKKEYFRRFRFKGEGTEKHRRNVRKKAMEAARYVLPVATYAFLYHTLSGITLLRYARLCDQPDVRTEQIEVVTRMLAEMLAYDPAYQAVIQKPLPVEQLPEAPFLGPIDAASCSRAEEFARSFDERMSGRFSTLSGWSQQAEDILAESVREVLGQPQSALGDEAAIRLALDPSRNTLLGQSLNLTTHSKLSRALFHPHYTFRKRLSHTADSQDQRHRMTPASRPILASVYTGKPDFITPAIISQDSECQAVYSECMAKTWDGINALLAEGVSPEMALYLLPNAATLRFSESSDLLNLRHKHAMRLCYNAQEEIWSASVEEALQIREIHPLIGRFLLPPCGHRELAGIKPYCPEGDRYCGIPVWRLDIRDYTRVI